jgi:hypothetical protein
MDREELKLIISATAEDAAERAVMKTLTMFGFDSDNPIEVQKDMAAIREYRVVASTEDYKKDQAHLRFWRQSVETAKSHALITIVGILATGAIVSLIPAARAWIGLD